MWSVLLVVACGGVALGLVNPQLQPLHLVDRYQAVIGGTITRADYDQGLVVFRVTRVCMGQFEPKEVAIQVPEVDQFDPSLFDDAEEGGTVVAYVGKSRRRHEREILLYAGQQWHQVEMRDPADASKWKWLEALGDEMVGTFNGAAEQLLAMMIDRASGRDLFPAYPTVKFKEAVDLDTFPGPLRGVALYDVDADGRLDVYACHPGGGRMYLQIGPMKFENRTAQLGLENVGGVSCSFADADADGRADLLADAVIYRQTGQRFEKTDLLPASANRRVKSAAFVEVNADGYPDVVASYHGGGLRVYPNPGAEGGPFRDATPAAGLDRAEAGADQTGFFAPGDCNGDGRTDLYFAVGKGLILLQDAQGRFSPLPHRMYFDYKTTGTSEPGMTGAGCFAPLWRPDSWDLVSPGDLDLMIVTCRNGVLRNLSGYANETRVNRAAQLATLAEDLNMDGSVDLFTITRKPEAENIFHANRGYGSYMLSELYMDYDGLPGKAFTTGAGGVAAGDVDGDGTTDLLLGGADGVLRLSLSDALAHELRQPREHPTALEKKLQQIRILTVRVAGKVGVLGAEVRVCDDQGQVVARRVIGSQVLTGCRSPDTLNLAIREPGKHTVAVRFSDGTSRTWPVDLTARKRVLLQAGREQGTQASDASRVLTRPSRSDN